MQSPNLQDLALLYHRRLPARVRAYLTGRGIPEVLIEEHLLGWDREWITIPIPNRKGEIIFFKRARDPESQRPGPKMVATTGSSIELYGWDILTPDLEAVVICEGEFDRLVLKAQGIPGITSTGGAGSFREEWVPQLETVPHLYICFDRDGAGRRGALRVARLLPQARIVELPEAVGDGGDITDYFVHLGSTAEDFQSLLETARLAPPPPPENLPVAPGRTAFNPAGRERVERLKASVSIESVALQYLDLRRTGDTLRGHCPFHQDRTPSLTIYPATDTFHCFGCGRHGDQIAFLQAKEQLTFPQALDVLEQFIRTS